MKLNPKHPVPSEVTLFLAPSFVVRFDPVTGQLNAFAEAPKPKVVPVAPQHE